MVFRPLADPVESLRGVVVAPVETPGADHTPRAEALGHREEALR